MDIHDIKRAKDYKQELYNAISSKYKDTTEDAIACLNELGENGFELSEIIDLAFTYDELQLMI